MAGFGRRRSSIVSAVAFALLVVFAFVLPWRQAVVLPWGISIGPIVGIALVAGWLLSVVLDGDRRRPHRSVRRLSGFHVAFAIFTAFAAASLLWTVDPARTLGRVAVYAYIFALLVVAWDVLYSRERLAIVVQALVLGVFLVGLVGIWQLLQQDGLGERQAVAHGVNANELARWVVLVVPFAAWLLDRSARVTPSTHRTRLSGYLNLAYLVASPFMVLSTGSRQGTVALAVLAVLGGVVLVRRRQAAVTTRHVRATLVLVGAIVVTASVVASLGVFFDRLPYALSRLDTLGGRTPIWQVGIDAIRDRPLGGVGAGAFGSLTPEGMSTEPHSVVVGVAAELGVVGLVLFVVVVAVPVATVASRPGPTIVSAGVLCALGLFATVATLYTDPFNWLVLLFVLAAHSVPADDEAQSAVTARRDVTDRRGDSRRRTGRIPRESGGRQQ